MVLYIKVNGVKVLWMAKVNIYGKMVIIIKDVIAMGKEMVKVSCFLNN
jgi:hypoxanthine-guanine phosphoribosyltransferase